MEVQERKIASGNNNIGTPHGNAGSNGSDRKTGGGGRRKLSIL